MRMIGSFALCVTIVAVGYGIIAIGATATKQEEGVNPDTPQADAIPPTNVVVRVLGPELFNEHLDLTGHLEAWETVNISAEVSGRIEWQGVEEGDRVEEGQELVRIDTETLNIELDRAEARAKQAALELKRVRDLEEGGVSSPRDLDNAVTDDELMRAELRAAKLRLEKSVIKAPLAGIVDTLDHEEGEYIDISTHLARLVQVDRLKAVVGMPERDVPRFKEGTDATMQFDALPDEVYDGDIYRIATSAEMATRSFRTEIAVENSTGHLRPGMNVRVRFIKESHEEALVVPLFSIVALENQFFVAVEKDGVAELRNVTVGAVEGGRALIESGLEPGDRLIVEGHRDLRDGAAVKVTSVENE